uniref:Uncharacterized protein n=1 Tax=Nelumbo nucifera TaxID=4432 RepID=A0A822ZIS0_NELNU|nr:TPA_asm: hypothetical protein HUJ06_004234 [Nelumbo nucifera]
MDEVKCMGIEFYGIEDGGSVDRVGGSGSWVLFPNLKLLTISDMNNLESFDSRLVVEIMLHLTTLRIDGCPKLKLDDLLGQEQYKEILSF